MAGPPEEDAIEDTSDAAYLARHRAYEEQEIARYNIGLNYKKNGKTTTAPTTEERPSTFEVPSLSKRQRTEETLADRGPAKRQKCEGYNLRRSLPTKAEDTYFVYENRKEN